MEDIYTNDSVFEMEYIIEHRDGRYYLVLSTGEKVQLEEDIAIMLLSDRIE